MTPHNPDNLTPEQIGTADGWRLLDEATIKLRQENCQCVECGSPDLKTRTRCAECAQKHVNRTMISRAKRQ